MLGQSEKRPRGRPRAPNAMDPPGWPPFLPEYIRQAMRELPPNTHLDYGDKRRLNEVGRAERVGNKMREFGCNGRPVANANRALAAKHKRDELWIAHESLIRNSRLSISCVSGSLVRKGLFLPSELRSLRRHIALIRKHRGL